MIVADRKSCFKRPATGVSKQDSNLVRDSNKQAADNSDSSNDHSMIESNPLLNYGTPYGNIPSSTNCHVGTLSTNNDYDINSQSILGNSGNIQGFTPLESPNKNSKNSSKSFDSGRKNNDVDSKHSLLNNKSNINISNDFESMSKISSKSSTLDMSNISNLPKSAELLGMSEAKVNMTEGIFYPKSLDRDQPLEINTKPMGTYSNNDIINELPLSPLTPESDVTAKSLYIPTNETPIDPLTKPSQFDLLQLNKNSELSRKFLKLVIYLSSPKNANQVEELLSSKKLTLLQASVILQERINDYLDKFASNKSLTFTEKLKDNYHKDLEAKVDTKKKLKHDIKNISLDLEKRRNYLEELKEKNDKKYIKLENEKSTRICTRQDMGVCGKKGDDLEQRLKEKSTFLSRKLKESQIEKKNLQDNYNEIKTRYTELFETAHALEESCHLINTKINTLNKTNKYEVQNGRSLSASIRCQIDSLEKSIETIKFANQKLEETYKTKSDKVLDIQGELAKINNPKQILEIFKLETIRFLTNVLVDFKKFVPKQNLYNYDLLLKRISTTIIPGSNEDNVTCREKEVEKSKASIRDFFRTTAKSEIMEVVLQSHRDLQSKSEKLSKESAKLRSEISRKSSYAEHLQNAVTEKEGTNNAFKLNPLSS